MKVVRIYFAFAAALMSMCCNRDRSTAGVDTQAKPVTGMVRPEPPPNGVTWASVRLRYIELLARKKEDRDEKEMVSLLRMYQQRVNNGIADAHSVRGVVVDRDGKPVDGVDVDIARQNTLDPWTPSSVGYVESRVLKGNSFDISFDGYEECRITFHKADYALSFVQLYKDLGFTSSTAQRMILARSPLPIEGDPIGLQVRMVPEKDPTPLKPKRPPKYPLGTTLPAGLVRAPETASYFFWLRGEETPQMTVELDQGEGIGFLEDNRQLRGIAGHMDLKLKRRSGYRYVWTQGRDGPVVAEHVD